MRTWGEKDETPAGYDLFRVTGWNKAGTISEYETYASDAEAAITHQREISKVVQVKRLDPRSRVVLDLYYYE